jgi:hypothetical protein
MPRRWLPDKKPALRRYIGLAFLRKAHELELSAFNRILISPALSGLRQSKVVKGKPKMNILETLISSGGGGIVNQLSSQFGIGSKQATAATSALIPALAGGLQENLVHGDPSGITDLINSGSLTQFIDNSDNLASPAALDQGRTLLGKIFGSGDTSNMVSTVSERVGVGTGIIHSMLPICATLLGGFLSKKVAAGGSLTDTVGQLASASHGGFMDTVRGLVSHLRA